MTGQPWWRDAVVYQIYPRSFADGDGDGVGDLAGIRAHLPYVRALGADAVWFTPWYPSAGADGGYDVADYRAIDPVFGTLAEAEALIAEAHELGLRTIVDVVPNHLAATHPWFAAAVAAGPGSPERDRFFFRAGRGARGDLPPNDWASVFGGPAWTRVSEPDGTPGEWYLHLFAPAQVDLNWRNAQVRAEFEDVLRFWFDRGVAGIRVDSATMISKDPALPPVPVHPGPGEHPYIDRDDVHDVYRGWRAVADAAGVGRILVGEVWLGDGARLARYLRPDEMHTAFNFDLMTQPWDPAAVRASIVRTLSHHAPMGAPATWVLSNHDVTRPVTRYGRTDTAFDISTPRRVVPTDLRLGTARARAAALLVGALPGVLYVYQGDELGLPEVEDLPPSARMDPIFAQTGGADLGRDGCRVPLPWDGQAPPFGFSPPEAAPPWLPQPGTWTDLTVARQESEPGSVLRLYRDMLRIRGAVLAGRAAPLRWVDAPDGAVAFERAGQLRCTVNMAGGPVPLPAGEVLLASGPLSPGELPPDTAVWTRVTSA
ncbi:glycoside hydrolase family 13 protein [Georgenia yuyongxinii]|uniref:Glycoside hydrolase family 13 protein n=1 Tax=Georgenia yuyongxinii TaxID=2589797 RepID=A0A552WS43_9MICO|nr:glycoside hydrolase family 13 protein [Georgenia yuyongxinii]TRW45409.1 glycoside hydrolase family 13 protein [Georgenia yuyongxinii]